MSKAITSEPKRKVGRPTKYSVDIATKLCEQLALGLSIRSVCAIEGMPAIQTVFNWLRKHKDFLEQYARAKEESTDAMAEEILDIADDGSNDYMTITKGNAEYEVVNHEAINRSRLRVDTRKWLMAKMKPKKYGDRLDVTSGGEKVSVNVLNYSQHLNIEAPNNDHNHDTPQLSA